jgi:uncharacterized HAD superfamily protein
MILQENSGKSPVLPEGIKNYLIDIDGTITEDVPNEDPSRMESCLPFDDAVTIIKKWYGEGHIITFFTSRTEEMREITTRWLDRYDIPYHHLLMNKPRGGNYHWIDNHVVRATRYLGKWTDLQTSDAKVQIFEK